MGWLDKLDSSVFTITTGDGKVFKPLWKNGETTKEFNASVFDFIDQEGSLVDRKKVKARKFPLVFWFTGDDNIEQSDAFDLSANDNRAWIVSHPFYGSLTGQPLSISRNDSSYNSTEVTVEFWETITTKLPKLKVSIADSISSKNITFHELSPVDYSSKVYLKPADITTVKSNADKISLAIASALDSSNYSEYQLLKNDMFAKVDNLILSPVPAMKAVNDMILLPSKFLLSVSNRINLIKGIYGSTKSVLIKSTRNNKAYFEVNGGSSIMALAQVLVNPLPTDYVTRTDIATAAEELKSLYNDYLVTLDAAYVDITDPVNSFSSSNATQSEIRATVIETIFNLTSLAFDAKQERTTILDKDSNLILLTHKYMGLDKNDENIERFRIINNIKNKSLFLVKKGRKITYYV